MSKAVKNNYIPAVEPNWVPAIDAIIRIAYGQWMTYEKVCRQDIFYDAAFTNPNGYGREIDVKHINMLGKDKMLKYAERLADGGQWTKEEWESVQGSVILGKIFVEQCLQETLKKYGLSLPDFVSKLQTSIDFENEHIELMNIAEQKLLDAARENKQDKKIEIWGKKNGSDGDYELIPLEFLLRDNFRISAYKSSFVRTNPYEILPIGWHGLKVKRADVERLWPVEQPIPRRVANRPNLTAPILQEYERRKNAGMLCGDWYEELKSLEKWAIEKKIFDSKGAHASLGTLQNKILKSRYETDCKAQNKKV